MDTSAPPGATRRWSPAHGARAHSTHRSLISSGASVLLLGSALHAAALFHQTDVYVAGQNGYFGYRIPGLECAPDGSLLAFAEARKHNLGDPGFDQNDIDLVLRRSTDRGATWSALTVIEDPGEGWSAANPATIVDRDTGKVWLFYLRCKPGRNTETARPGTDDNQILARSSTDNGGTWSEPVDLTTVSRDLADPQWRSSVVGPGGGIQARDGRLVLPVWRYAPWRVFAVFSADHGKTWQRGEPVPNLEGDECQLVELADGRLMIDARQHAGPHRWLATSADGGRTWSEPRPGEEVTPVCTAIERLTAKTAGNDRDRILWTGPKGPDRSNLVARVSYDEGRTFPQERLIASGPAAYSDIARLRDGTVGVLWERGVEHGYQFIAFTRFNLEWIESADATVAPKLSGPLHKVISRGEAAGSYQAFPDVCRLDNGDLLCVFYAGYGHVSLPREDCPRGGRICSVRSPDDGRTWSAPRLLYDGPFDDRDPHIAQMRDGSVVCSFFTYRPQPDKRVLCDTCLVASRDGGQTFDSDARVVAAGWPSSAPVRELPDGTRLLGVYREDEGTAFGGVIRSTDSGRTWSAPIPIGKDSGVRLDAETDVVQLENGSLFAALRGDRQVHMHYATSPDAGLTWSPVKDIGFLGHCPHLTRLRTGAILLTHRLPNTALHVSRDEGRTWQGPHAIDATVGAYASTVELKDGTVLVVYYEEGQGSAIRIRRFKLEADGIEFLPWE